MFEYIITSLVANRFYEEGRQPLKYIDLDAQRLPLTTLSLEKATNNFKKIVKLKSAIPQQESEEFIILAYLEKTGIYQKLRDILYDVYYGKKFPNPLPRIIMKIEEFNRKFSEVILSRQVVEEELYRADTKLEEAKSGGKVVADYFRATNQDVIDLNLRPMYGLFQMVRSLPIQNLDTILLYIDELNWRNVAPAAGNGYSFYDIMSLGYKTLFQSPDLFGVDDTIIELNHDFYFEEASQTQALQAVASIQFELMTAIDLKYSEKKIVPIGFYEGDQISAFITFNDILTGNQSRTGLMEILIKTMNSGKAVHTKFIVVINKKGVIDFKLFRINLNVLLIDGASIFSAKKDLKSQDFLRMFTSPRDCAYFSIYVPYSKQQVLTSLQREAETAKIEGQLTKALQTDTVSAMIEEQKDRVVTDVTTLANRALYILKLAERYDLLFQTTYIFQNGGTSPSKSWSLLDLIVVDKFFEDFYQEMIKSFADYELTHLDGIFCRVINLHQFTYKFFQKSVYIGKIQEYIWEKAKWIKLRASIGRIKSMLEAMSSYLLIVAKTNSKK